MTGGETTDMAVMIEAAGMVETMTGVETTAATDGIATVGASTRDLKMIDGQTETPTATRIAPEKIATASPNQISLKSQRPPPQHPFQHPPSL